MDKERKELVEMISQMTEEQFEWFINQALLVLSDADA
jgi:hypothetical protein